MNETTAELLPCPFCGEQPDRIDDHRVQCCNDQCGNYIKMMNIQDWNKRTDSTTQIAALEQDYHDLAETQLDYQKLTHEQREQIAALRSALRRVDKMLLDASDDDAFARNHGDSTNLSGLPPRDIYELGRSTLLLNLMGRFTSIKTDTVADLI